MSFKSSDIFKFTSYRAFLCAYAEAKRKESSSWSYGMWAKRLKLGGTASLSMILNGQRNPGKEVSRKLEKYFDFSKKESEYFRDLILLEKMDNDARMSVLLMDKLSRISPYQSFIKVDDKELRVISKWYYYALREMVHLQDFKEDYDWISQRMNFKVNPRDVKKAIDDLLMLKLLKRDEQGKLTYSYGSLNTPSEVSSQYLKQFHEQMIANAKESIRKNNVEDRSINGMTLTIKKEKISHAKELINKFQDDLCKLMEEDRGDETYQLNIQFFPLTKITRTL